MGKTLMAYFSAFPANNVSQFFLRQGEPTNTDVCENYYRFSDLDAVKSILNHKIRGTVFDKTQISGRKHLEKKGDVLLIFIDRHFVEHSRSGKHNHFLFSIRYLT